MSLRSRILLVVLGGLALAALRPLTRVGAQNQAGDLDGDGVDDVFDLCPLEAETRNGFSDLSPAKLAEMEAESLLLFGPRPGSVLGPLEIEFGEAKRIKRRLLEVPVLVSFRPGALEPPPVEGRETELVLTVGALDYNGVRSDLPQMPLRFTMPEGADGSTRVRSRLTVHLRSIEQRLVFQLRDPVSGGSFVTEVSYMPGK